MNKSSNHILKTLSLSPLVGLIPVYILWACETYYELSTFTNTGYQVNYRDPKIYSAYSLVSACTMVLFTLLIPSLIATVIGCFLVFRNKAPNAIKSLLFYSVPIILFIIVALNITTRNCHSIFGAFYWFAD